MWIIKKIIWIWIWNGSKSHTLFSYLGLNLNFWDADPACRPVKFNLFLYIYILFFIIPPRIYYEFIVYLEKKIIFQFYHNPTNFSFSFKTSVERERLMFNYKSPFWSCKTRVIANKDKAKIWHGLPNLKLFQIWRSWTWWKGS